MALPLPFPAACGDARVQNARRLYLPAVSALRCSPAGFGVALSPPMVGGIATRRFGTPPLALRRLSPVVAKATDSTFTLDRPASHRLNSGSDWPSNEDGELSVRPV